MLEVPDEPDANDADAILLLFILPNGTRLERRFRRANMLKVGRRALVKPHSYNCSPFCFSSAHHFHPQDLHTYIFCHPESPDAFAIATNFPKRTLETEESLVQINAAGIGNREVLYVYDLDA